MTDPSVSVVIPTYERKQLVVGAIESVLAQSAAPVEVIVVDDGSTDGTEQALRRYEGRINYHYQPNLGVSTARNAGVRLSSGSIVAFLDSDDQWHPHHLEVLVAALTRYPSASLAATGPLHPHVHRARPLESPEHVDALCPLLPAFGLVTTPSRVAVRREAFDAVGGFDQDVLVAEDSDLWVRLAVRGSFVLLSDSTLTRGRAANSLARRGMQESLYMPTFLRHAETHAAEVATHRPNDHEARSHAAAQRYLASALQASTVGDVESARRQLEKALEETPWLSHEPRLIAHRIGRVGPREQAHARFACVAAGWPDRDSPTARYLRAAAFGSAFRARDPRELMRVLSRCPPLSTHRLFGEGFVTALRGELGGPM